MDVKRQSKTFWARIYIAGDYDTARQICREFCMSGLCVNISKVDYIYTMGEECGVCVELINYPRFATTETAIYEKAKDLGKALLLGLCQGSFLIMTPINTYYFSRREEIREANKTEDRLT